MSTSTNWRQGFWQAVIKCHNGIGAADVQSEPYSFVAFVEQCSGSMIQQLEDRRRLRAQEALPLPQEIMLVFSPGYGILESGCGRTIVGQDTLRAFEKIWMEQGIKPPKPSKEINTCRYGNGETEVSEQVVYMPVTLAGRRGLISAAVVKGQAPLVISKSALQSLHACMDFAKNQIKLFPEQDAVTLQTNAVGQLMLPLMESEPGDSSEPAIPCLGDESAPQDVQAVIHGSGDQTSHVVSGVASPMHTRIRDGWGIQQAPAHTPNGPKWDKIRKRVVRNGENNKVLHQDEIVPNINRRHLQLQHTIPQEVKHVITEFHYEGEQR